MLTEEERLARYTLALTNLTPSNFLKILKKYGSARKFIGSEDYQSKFFTSCEDTKPKEINEKFVVYGEDTYPQFLMETPYPPIALTYRGNLDLFNNPKLISIVGTRKLSPYGQRVTKSIVEKLAQDGYVFVSGMALGVDTVVHKTAIGVGAKTIAVLPTTLDNPTPKSNYGLFEEISKEGLVICEPKYKYLWNKYLYAQRNRIIAGLSKITLVTEAPPKSGALITANLAFEYNRDVFAVPGNIDSSASAGCNLLLKNNKAQLFTDVRDILPEQTLFYESVDIDPQSKIVINLLKTESAGFDDILKKTDIQEQELKSLILQLEMQGIICLNRNGKYNMKVV